MLTPVVVQVEHIGSTSVALVEPLCDLGCEDAKIAPVFQRRMSSRGPWQEAGPVHLHFTAHGSDTWAEPILMRDYLRVRPEDAAWYAGVKQASAAAHGRDLNGYHESKSECVLTLIGRARAWHAGPSG